MKHTEGPWKIGYTIPPGGGERALSIVPASTKEGVRVAAICLISPESAENDTDRANAALISKAPELLKALEECVDKMQEEQDSGVKEGIYEDEPREDIIALRELIFEAKGITGVCPKCEESFANHNDDGSCVKD